MPADTFGQATAPGREQASGEATVERTFDTGDYCRLIIENPRGRIRVFGWDRPQVSLRAVKQRGGSSPARFEATRIELSHDGSTVHARTVVDGGFSFPDSGDWGDLLAEAIRSLGDLLRFTVMPVEVVYDVQVPRHANLDLKGVTSQVSVENVRGVVHVASVSGSQKVAQVQGDVNLSTVSGEVVAQGLVGYIDAKSVSGGVSLGGSLDVVRANSVSGSMELAGPLSASGSYDFHTVSGSLTLRVPPDTSATIDARGVSMAVTSDLPCQVTQDRRSPGSRHWQARLDGGGAAIHVNTVSGHLYLAKLNGVSGPTESREPEPAAAGEDETPPRRSVNSSPDASTNPVAEGPAAAASPTEAVPESSGSPVEPEAAESAQLRVLRALERGELSVEDALKQIEALKGHDQ